MLSCVLLISCSKNEGNYLSGTYIGEAEGYHSTLKVEVTVDENHILDIEVLEHEEAPIIADATISKLPLKVIKKNSTDVDVISGATYTSKTLLKAIDHALEQAKRE